MPDPDPEDVDFDAELDDLDLTMRMTAALTAATDPATDPVAALLPAALAYRADALAHPRSFADGQLLNGPGAAAVQLLLSRIGTPAEFNAAVLGLCEGLASRELRGELPGGVAVWSVGIEALLRGWGLLSETD